MLSTKGIDNPSLAPAAQPDTAIGMHIRRIWRGSERLTASGDKRVSGAQDDRFGTDAGKARPVLARCGL